MNRNKLNNTNTAQSGQVLLIIVMLLATVLTIVMTASLSTTNQTQATKDQEESIKVRAAAESALDLALSEDINTPRKKFSEYPQLQEVFKGINMEESYVQVSGGNADSFVSPVVEKDTQYTFYLADYNGGTFNNPYTGSDLKIYYGNNQADCNEMAVEFTIVSGNAPYTITRFIADPQRRLMSDVSANRGVELGNPKTFDPAQFYCQADMPAQFPSSMKLMIIRPLYADTRFAFEPVGGSSLPSQGKTVKAVAKSTNGVTKAVELFQSYPQLPASMFVTSF